MCFRPTDIDAGGPIICPACEKKINRIDGQVPKKCPFCKTEFNEELLAGAEPAGIEEIVAPTAPVAPTTSEDSK